MSEAPHPIDELFHAMVKVGASDLHLSVGSPPLVRKDGHMEKLDPAAVPLTAQDLVHLLGPIMPEKNRKEFTERHDTDFAYEIAGLARFRSNVFADRQGPGAVFRVIPTKILTAEQLGLSPFILQLCALNKGLVLVTGPTGSGQVDDAVRDDRPHQHARARITSSRSKTRLSSCIPNQKCLINQREVHTHTDSFKAALRAALREDPDIVLVGELRDLETVAIAIETAETGHLVFGTLHTTTAASTVDRIVDQFPADRQEQIRIMLSESLRGVIAQNLCRKIGGGRVAALEVLIATQAVSNLIREGKTFQIPSIMQVGKAIGMVSLNDALMELVTKKLVTPDEAYSKAVDKGGFEALLKRAGLTLEPKPKVAGPRSGLSSCRHGAGGDLHGPEHRDEHRPRDQHRQPGGQHRRFRRDRRRDKSSQERRQRVRQRLNARSDSENLALHLRRHRTAEQAAHVRERQAVERRADRRNQQQPDRRRRQRDTRTSPPTRRAATPSTPGLQKTSPPPFASSPAA